MFAYMRTLNPEHCMNVFRSELSLYEHLEDLRMFTSGWVVTIFNSSLFSSEITPHRYG